MSEASIVRFPVVCSYKTHQKRPNSSGMGKTSSETKKPKLIQKRKQKVSTLPTTGKEDNMDRNEVFNSLSDEEKFDFRVGELAYNRETDYGTKPLAEDDARNLTTEELFGILSFIIHLQISNPSDIAAKDETTLSSCSSVLQQRQGQEHEPTPVFPSYHGEKCIANGKHAGVECCCDECHYYLECWPDWREINQ